MVTGGGGWDLSDVDAAGGIEDCPGAFPACALPAPQLTSIASEKTFHATFISVDGEEAHVQVIDTGDSIVDQFKIVTP